MYPDTRARLQGGLGLGTPDLDAELISGQIRPFCSEPSAWRPWCWKPCVVRLAHLGLQGQYFLPETTFMGNGLGLIKCLLNKCPVCLAVFGDITTHTTPNIRFHLCNLSQYSYEKETQAMNHNWNSGPIGNGSIFISLFKACILAVLYSADKSTARWTPYREDGVALHGKWSFHWWPCWMHLATLF